MQILFGTKIIHIIEIIQLFYTIIAIGLEVYA